MSVGSLPNLAPELSDSEAAFVTRFRAWLDQQVQRGRLPWSAQSGRFLLNGTCLGVRVPGSFADDLVIRRDPPRPGDKTACRVLLFANAMVTYLAREADAPADWSGTPHEVCVSLWPLAKSNDIVAVRTLGERFRGISGIFPETVRLPGVGRVEVYRVENPLLGVYRGDAQ